MTRVKYVFTYIFPYYRSPDMFDFNLIINHVDQLIASARWLLHRISI